MKTKYMFLMILHLFVGVGALGGGLAGMLDPEEPLGIPADLLDQSPFEDFFIPSLILFTVIGLGHIFSALAAVYFPRYQGYTSSIFSWALVIWIVVQVIMIRAINILHVLYFLIGLVGAVLALRILIEERAFPLNLVLKDGPGRTKK